MSLTFLEHKSLDYFPLSLVDVIKKVLKKHNTAWLLLPTYAQVKEVQKLLAQHQLGKGVQVCTPSQLLSNLWNQFTDGRRIASFPATETVALEILQNKSQTQGFTTLVAQTASRAASLLDDAKDKKLSPEQMEAVTHAKTVRERLSKKGFITPSEAAAIVWDRVDNLDPVICTGFMQMDSSLLATLEQLIQKTSVYVAIPQGNGPTFRASNEVKEALGQLCSDYSTESIADDSILRASRLEELNKALNQETSAPLDASESVSIIEPLGPTAEAESIARYLDYLSQNGYERCLVVCSNPKEMWQKLSPKLSVRGIKVKCEWSETLEETKPVALFLKFVDSYLKLCIVDDEDWDTFFKYSKELQKDPASKLLRFSQLPRDWWPPKAIIDFLQSNLCELPPKWVDDFDATIRNNRVIFAGSTSQENIRSLLKKFFDKNEAMRHLLQKLNEYDLAGALEVLMTTALKNHAGQDVLAIKKLYAILVEGQEVLEEETPLETYIAEIVLLSLLSRITSVSSSYERGSFTGDSRMEVEIVSPRDAITRLPQSVEVCMLCGQTMDLASHVTRTTAETYLFEKLGIVDVVSKHAQLTAEDAQLIALPTTKLIFEKQQFDSEGAATEPSPLLAKVKSLYSESAFFLMQKETTEQFGLGEEQISANYRLDGKKAEEVEELEIENDLILEAEAREVAPKALIEKRELTSGTRLSPTALETLYDCPRKWFFSRAIASTDQDAIYSALSKGNVYHHFLQEAFVEHQDPKDFQKEFLSSFSSTIDAPRAENMAVQNYLPHTLSQFQQVEEVGANLKQLLEKKKTIFTGFTPTFFEYAIDESFMTYLGAGVKGFIDRIDIDKDGNVIIIDYKSSSKSAMDGYTFKKKELSKKIMHHPQIYTYARIVEQMSERLLQEMPEDTRPKTLQIVGVVYAGVDRAQGLYGVLDERFEETVSSRVENNLAFVPQNELQEIFMDVEKMMKESVDVLYAGVVKTEPRRPDVCTYCAFAYGCAWRRKSEEEEIERFKDYSEQAQKEGE